MCKKKEFWEFRNCVYCDEEFEIRIKNKKKLCSQTCRKKWASLPVNIESRINASRKAVKEKFGVDNVFQLESIKDKSKKTKLKKYGDENYNNSELGKINKINKFGEDYYFKMSEKRKKLFILKYGVDHHFKIKSFLDKQKETVRKNYGVDNISQLEEVKKKKIKTIFNKYGVENASQSEEIKEKKKKTSLKNFGVTHHLKDYNMLQKHFKAQYKIKNFKDTELYYQGSYEYYFLERIEKLRLLHEVKKGKSYKYTHLNKEHIYHTDFVFQGENIEIKSSWTYNNNGENCLLQNINHAKWNSVREFGDKINVLINKEGIDLFINKSIPLK